MSWMVVRGKVYHCSLCNYSFVIEYEGGERPVQVSDPVIAQQERLRQHYGGDPALLHHQAMCENCAAAAKATHATDVMSVDTLSEISQLARSLQEWRSALMSSPRRFVTARGSTSGDADRLA